MIIERDGRAIQVEIRPGYLIRAGDPYKQESGQREEEHDRRNYVQDMIVETWGYRERIKGLERLEGEELDSCNAFFGRHFAILRRDLGKADFYAGYLRSVMRVLAAARQKGYTTGDLSEEDRLFITEHCTELAGI